MRTFLEIEIRADVTQPNLIPLMVERGPISGINFTRVKSIFKYKPSFRCYFQHIVWRLKSGGINLNAFKILCDFYEENVEPARPDPISFHYWWDVDQSEQPLGAPQWERWNRQLTSMALLVFFPGTVKPSNWNPLVRGEPSSGTTGLPRLVPNLLFRCIAFIDCYSLCCFFLLFDFNRQSPPRFRKRFHSLFIFGFHCTSPLICRLEIFFFVSIFDFEEIVSTPSRSFWNWILSSSEDFGDSILNVMIIFFK